MSMGRKWCSIPPRMRSLEGYCHDIPGVQHGAGPVCGGEYVSGKASLRHPTEQWTGKSCTRMPGRSWTVWASSLTAAQGAEPVCGGIADDGDCKVSDHRRKGYHHGRANGCPDRQGRFVFCLKSFAELKAEGISILYISHTEWMDFPDIGSSDRVQRRKIHSDQGHRRHQLRREVVSMMVGRSVTNLVS